MVMSMRIKVKASDHQTQGRQNLEEEDGDHVAVVRGEHIAILIQAYRRILRNQSSNWDARAVVRVVSRISE